MTAIRAAATLTDAERQAFRHIIDAVWHRPDSQQMFIDDMAMYDQHARLFEPFYAIAEQDGEITGLFILITSVTSDELLTISWAAVDPARQGGGLGRLLLETCLAETERRGKRLLVATSVPVFFTRCGLHVVEEYFYTQPRFLLMN